MWGRARDPVYGVRVNKTTPYWYKQNDKTFYFDCSACRQTFIDDTQGFLGDGIKKGFLQKLPEENDGERKTCH